MASPSVYDFGLMQGTTRTIYARWNWGYGHTLHYEVNWYYDTGDGKWFVGSDSTTTWQQDTYDAPDIAKRVKFLCKPISETYTKETTDRKGNTTTTEMTYWTASYSTAKIYDFSNNPPQTPPVPTVELDKYTLKMEINNLNMDELHAKGVEFQVVKDNYSIFDTARIPIKTNFASYSCRVTSGSMYKVRARSYDGPLTSPWSEYSGNYSTAPQAPAGIISIRATSKTSVYLKWSSVDTADSYDIEYATKRDYFDQTDQTTVVSAEHNYYEFIGLESGYEYFFRVRAVNDEGVSPWCSIRSVVIGKNPESPTTWSSTTTVVVGEPLFLYWVHNSEDNSSQKYAELELVVDGKKTTHTIKNSEDEDEKDKTSVFEVNTSGYREGAKIQWRVRTMGVTEVYGEWSIERTVDVYAPAVLSVALFNNADEHLETLERLPFSIKCTAGPNTQTPTGYYISITSNEQYETVDSVGNFKMVNKGTEIWSKYYDISEPILSVTLSANDITLENNISYTVTAKVAMNSGLTAEAKAIFRVGWTADIYVPDAEIGIDTDIFATYIRPYIVDEEGQEVFVENVLLSVYRREFDGTFTEIMSNIGNGNYTYIVDPHPSLDFARYRIVATSKDTGTVSYSDLPDLPVKCKSTIIQWDEQWEPFISTNNEEEDETVETPWTGSILKLLYNIDVSEKYNSDVTLVKYIGRSHPVSYHGTQLGQTFSLNTDIPKSDKETIYALRRLANWLGNVYIREPSGLGYYATIKVSFSQKHCDLVVPISIEVTRVEGGV